MIAAYGQASSYEDHGRVTVTYTGGTSHSWEGGFQTSFLRAEGFRFAARGEFRNDLVWTDGATIKSYQEGGSIEDQKTLVRAQYHSSVPGLLLPSHADHAVMRHLRDLRISPAPELVDGHPCWRIDGTRRTDEHLTLWIDQAAHILRRMRKRVHFVAMIDMPAFDAETTTEYQPILDGPIRAERVHGPDPERLPPPRPKGMPFVGIAFAADMVHVERVIPGQAAERGGIQSGDEVVSIDGVATQGAREVISAIGTKLPATSIAVVVRRNGAPQSLTIVVGDQRQRENNLYNRPAPPLTVQPSLSLAALRGNVVVLAFISTSQLACIDCTRPISMFVNELQDKYAARGLQVIQISDEPGTVLTQFARDHRLEQKLVHDDDHRTSDAYAIDGRASFVLIDRSGILRFTFGQSAVEALVDDMLDDPTN